MSIIRFPIIISIYRTSRGFFYFCVKFNIIIYFTPTL
nr:MAG TPA: hypothetical protein [Bacteriophage sp.]